MNYQEIPPKDLEKVEPVVASLVKRHICLKKKKERGWKYYLNMARLDKINELIK